MRPIANWASVHNREILVGYGPLSRTPKEFPMGLFTADLYRSFAVGFGLGAVALAVTVGSQLLPFI